MLPYFTTGLTVSKASAFAFLCRLSGTKQLFTFLCILLLKRVMSLYFHNSCINSITIRHNDVQNSMTLVSEGGLTASLCSIYDLKELLFSFSHFHFIIIN